MPFVVIEYVPSSGIEINMSLALVNSDGEMANYVTTSYWKELMEENEKCRFSSLSREALNLLKRAFKYNSFEKRDGSIVGRVIENCTIIHDEEQVNHLLMEHLKSIQRDDKRSLYEESPLTPFPVFDKPSLKEMKEILEVITINKALTDDFISDIILTKDHFERTCEVLQDLWSGINIDELHFRSRLITLNQKHPNIPHKDQFRPIIISSLLTKILEAKLVKPLRRYMVEKLHISQTGFVPSMDIYVNINRMITYVHGRREKGIRTFILFLDFSCCI